MVAVEPADAMRRLLALLTRPRPAAGIRTNLFLSPKTVEAHIRHIFLKLGLRETPEYHRRVVAGLTYLRGSNEPVG